MSRPRYDELHKAAMEAIQRAGEGEPHAVYYEGVFDALKWALGDDDSPIGAPEDYEAHLASPDTDGDEE